MCLVPDMVLLLLLSHFSRVRLLAGSSVHRIFKARVLEWGAIAFSGRGASEWQLLLPLLLVEVIVTSFCCNQRSYIPEGRNSTYENLEELRSDHTHLYKQVLCRVFL